MTPIQQLMLGVGASKKTYVDDIFSTFVYEGNGYHVSANPSGATSRDIVNGIDFTEGGLAIFNTRNQQQWWQWVDTVNGATNSLASNSGNALDTNRPNGLKTFNNNGFTIGYDSLYNVGNVDYDYSSWSFRKASGFFDVVEFTETGSVGTDMTISHQLGSVPGMIIIKTTSRTSDWFTYHRGSGASKYLALNGTMAAGTLSSGSWGPVTSTSFNFNSQVFGYGAGTEWIAYVFAGGESDAATARSVGFSSSSTYLSIPDSNDFDFGSTFTFEAWVKPEFHNGNLNMIFEHGSFQIAVQDSNRLQFDPNHIHTGGDFYSSTGSVPEGQWTHVAVVGTSGTLKMYINGVNDQSHSRTGVDITGDTGAVTISDSTGYYFKGEISNLRIVKGTAVYASSFRPPTEPLTNITNTVLLCCNDSSTTGSTVTPNTITANGSPTAETDSPFDDPAAHVFGASGSENVIKTGSYTGNGVGWQPTDSPPNLGLFVECGFEPQWVMLKRANPSGSDWKMVNCMTGLGHNVNGETLAPNLTDAGVDEIRVWAEPTGFRLGTSSSQWNYNGGEYIFCAVRRSDGYVGKPVELGTSVFAMDTAASSVPRYSSGFPVDFAFKRRPATSESWYTGARIIGKNRGYTDASTAFSDNNSFVWDSSTHWPGGGGDDANVYQAWMWKRHAGLDVLAYISNEIGNGQLTHSLGKIPEMIFFKSRDANQGWGVWHKGLNGGSNSDQYYLRLDSSNSETGGSSNTDRPLASAPTSTHISLLSTSTFANYSTHNYIAMLFASTKGISAVGSYVGNGSARTIDFPDGGFTPRFIIIKNASGGGDWITYDTVRGFPTSGNAPYLFINTTAAQTTGTNYINATSTGFSLPGSALNSSSGGGATYIYYAHA